MTQIMDTQAQLETYMKKQQIIAKNLEVQIIIYVSKTLDIAQINYIFTEKEILELFYAFENLKAYLEGEKVIVPMNHAVIQYLFNKKDEKHILFRWILLLQEF